MQATGSIIPLPSHINSPMDRTERYAPVLKAIVPAFLPTEKELLLSGWIASIIIVREANTYKLPCLTQKPYKPSLLNYPKSEIQPKDAKASSGE